MLAIKPQTEQQSPQIQDAIALLESLGFCPLPVVPLQSADQWPKRDRLGQVVKDLDGNPKPQINGKSPSYFNSEGKPRLIKNWAGLTEHNPNWGDWGQYQALGVANNQPGRRWIDIDRRHFPDSQAFNRCIERLKQHAIVSEFSPSGWHGLIRFELDPLADQAQVNISIDGIGHCGEIPGFVVVSPSRRADGSQYVLDFVNLEAEAVKDLAVLGLAPTKTEKANNQPAAAVATAPAPAKPKPKVETEAPAASQPLKPQPKPFDPPRPILVSLKDLISKNSKAALSGSADHCDNCDRSEALILLARDLWGWFNLAKHHGILTDKPDPLISKAAEALGISDKLKHCLKEVDTDNSDPALAKFKGVDHCVERLKVKAGLHKPQPAAKLDPTEQIILTAADMPGRVAYRELYSSGDYCRIGDDLYKFIGTHYQKCDERAEAKRISRLFDRCVLIAKKKGEFVETYPYATKTKVADAWFIVLCSVRYVPANEVNVGGLNLLNGILTFDWDRNGIPQPRLIEHSPDLVFTHEPKVAYHPEADDTYAEKLIQAIDPAYRDAVLRVFSAAIDLDEVRKRKGRLVRSLIFTGTGNNGKDSLRECVSYIFGKVGVTGCTIDDFAAYDQGRRFNLASLSASRINWASENRCGTNIDNIQSLKQVITGDPLTSEEKHKQGQEFTPRCITIFSTNDSAINLTASQEAIASRYAIVPFRKTFVTNPTKTYELKADPRFKYDPEWIKSEVCPALLNILISQFQALFADGIDYSSFDEAMERNRLEVNHLLQFANDYGLEECDGAKLSNAELWSKLSHWYETEGYLRHDGSKEIWADEIRAGDPWVRGVQHLKRRLQKIFPNIESYRSNTERGLVGLRFVDPVEKALTECESWEQYLRICDLKGAEAVQAVWPNLSPEVRDRIVALDPSNQRQSEQPAAAAGDDVEQPASVNTEETAEPLPDEEILGWAELLKTAVSLSNTTNYEDFRRDVSKADQSRVLDCLGLDIRTKVRDLHKLWEKKHALAGVQ